jgi:hypothetical protein
MALHLLTAVLPREEFTEEDAIAIVVYHIRRNQTALSSHTKSWKKRHEKVDYKVLL